MTSLTIHPFKARPDLDALLERARQLPPMTPAQSREQRISFAYGNGVTENPRITREMVERLHDETYGRPGDDNAGE
jgi:hypothetical protein